MTLLRELRKRGVAALVAATLIVGGLVFNGAAPAHAAGPVTVTDPVSGASVTLSSGRIKPGETIQISGTGFQAKQGSTGDPLVAVRPYDFDAGPAWTVGGTDAHFPGNPTVPPASEAKYWFVTYHEDGTFTGTLTAPRTLTAAGPLGNGQHWLRILSGAFFTTTGDRLTDPITFQVPFEVAETRASVGLTSPTAVFQAGTIFRPGAQVTVRGEDFAPGQPVTVTIDGAAVASSITTEADGTLPQSARVALPADIATGAHTLRLATGSDSATVAFTVTAPPTATVLTTTVRAGGTIAYDLTGYIGVGGAGQKVAIVVNEAVLKCVQTGSNGSASGTVQLPGGLVEAVTVGFNVGLSCQLPPTGVINDQPIGRIAPTLTVSETAPEVAAGTAWTSSPLTVSGSGFAPNADVTISLGGTTAGTLRASDSGSIKGQVTAPTKAGEYRLLAQDGGTVAAASVTVQALQAFTTSAPAISGTKSVGKTLTAKVSWKPAPSKLTYQWLRDGKAISKATKSSYKLTKTDAGKKISVKVTGTKTGYTTAAKTSSKVTIAKVKSTVKVTSLKSVKKGKKATLKVTIGSAVAKPTGTVKVTVNGKTVKKTVKSSAKGKVSITLPAISKKGSYKVKASFTPSGSTAKSTSKSSTVTKTLKVT